MHLEHETHRLEQNFDSHISSSKPRNSEENVEEGLRQEARSSKSSEVSQEACLSRAFVHVNFFVCTRLLECISAACMCHEGISSRSHHRKSDSYCAFNSGLVWVCVISYI